MRFSRIFLFMVCAASMALASSSCITVDKTLGKDYIPTDDKIQMGIATLALPLQQMTMDSLQSRSSSYFILGQMKTVELGGAEFSFAADVYPSISGMKLGKDAVVTKAYLNMKLSSAHIIDPNEKYIMQEVEIYSLKEPLDTDMIYCNSYSEGNFYDPVPINTQSVEIFGNDSLNAYISSDYAQELIVATQRELDTLKYFTRSHRGLYFRLKEPAYNPPHGGRVNLFEFSSGTLFIWINFQPTWADNLEKKDTILTYNIGYDNSLNLSTYSSAHLKSEQGESPREEIYMEGIGGIKPYVSMTDLKEIVDNWVASLGVEREKILIAKATINLPFNQEMLKIGEYLTMPETMYATSRVLDTTDNKIYYQPLSDANSSGNSYGTMNRSLALYSGDVTTYIHELVHKDLQELEKDKESYDIWFNPVSYTSDYYGNLTFDLDNEHYYFGKINGPAHSNPPTITILYSVLN